MSYVEGSLGSMLQGVSQQPTRLRADGQVTEQINYDSDVSRGLVSRPASFEIGELELSDNDWRYQFVRSGGEQFILGYANAVVRVWDLDGHRLTHTGSTLYVGEDMVFYPDSPENQIICVNRDTETAMSSDPAPGRPFNAAVVSCLGGLFSRTYKVTIKSGVEEVELSVTTPDGDGAGDADETSSVSIVSALKADFDGQTTPAGMTASVSDSTLLIEYTDSLTVTTDDGEGGTTLRPVTDEADDVTFLPDTAKHGHIVKVRGGPSEDDDYYLRFDSDVTDTEGLGFGDPGVWREVADPDEQNNFDLSTMPHKLVIDTVARTSTFSTIQWEPRRVGDSNTAPEPDFIGSAIRDANGFEDRIVFVAGSYFFTTRSTETRDLWRRSATTEAADDPISIRSNNTGGYSLDWIVPFDRDLLLISDPGKAQFVVTGGGLSAGNASMVLTTEYEVNSGVRPVSTGRTIGLPFKTGQFVGLNEFFTNDVVATNGAEPLTAVQDRYMPGDLTLMGSAENFSRLVLGSTGDKSTLFVYRWLWAGSERLQSSWHKYQFPHDVLSLDFSVSDMYVVLAPDYTDGVVLARMDMNRVIDDAVGYHVTLDRRLTRTVAGSNRSVFVPYPDAVAVQSTGCSNPGLLVSPTTELDPVGNVWEIQLPESCPEGAEVILGQAIHRELVPSEPQARDRQGNVISKATLYVKAFDVHLEDSGDITAEFISPFREDRTFERKRFPLDDEPLDPDRRGLLDYVLRVPWGERSDRAELKLTSTNVRPDTILEIEWRGDVRGMRRRM